MALIHKKPKTRGAFNPLLADPTRTTTLRRVFSQALRGRLKILAQRVNQVIISENALGIRPTQNVFCPTGPGGGVDPSCGKSTGVTIPEFSSTGHYPIFHVTDVHNLKSIMSSGLGTETGTISWTRDPLYSIQDKKVRLIVKDKQNIDKETHSHIGLVKSDSSPELKPAKFEHEEVSRGGVSFSKIDEVHIPQSVMHQWHLGLRNNLDGLKRLEQDLSDPSLSERKRKLYTQRQQTQQQVVDEYKRLIDHPKIRVVAYGVRDKHTGEVKVLNYNPLQPRVAAGSSHGGEWTTHHKTAVESAHKASKAFGLPIPEVKFVQDSNQGTYGEHSTGVVHLVNIHEGKSINKSLNFKPSRIVTEGEHLAAHEVAHEAYSANPELGRKMMDRLKGVNAEYGSGVSIYGAFNGPHENLMELGASYIHSPKELKAYSQDMYNIAHEWSTTLRKENAVSNELGNRNDSLLQWNQKERGYSLCLRSGNTEGQKYLELQEVPKSDQGRKENVLYRRLDNSEATSTNNTRWMFNTTSEQVKAFATWFLEQAQELLYGQEENSWWREYVQKAYEQGAGSTWAKWKSKSNFLQGAFNNPVQIERVKTLAGRVLTELKNVTQTMATQMSRSLVDGLAQGKSPRDVAKDLTATVSGLGENRASMIARTETVRAHAEGQLDSLENLGMDQVGVQVEWTVSGLGKTRVTGSKKKGTQKGGNPSPCALCAPMKGVVFTIQEARGLLPRHPNCLCSLVPAGVGEDTSGQKIGKRPINDALRQSIKAEIPAASKTTLAQQMSRTKWVGADRIGKISGKPPGEISENFNPNHDKEGKFSSVPSSVMSDFNKMMDVAMVQAKPPEKPATMKIYEAMSHVESGADMGALVTMKDLRKHTQIPKEKFDKAVIDLFKSQMVMPHYHDFATSLAPHELAELVDSGTDQHANAGRYWVGIAKRRGTTNSESVMLSLARKDN